MAGIAQSRQDRPVLVEDVPRTAVQEDGVRLSDEWRWHHDRSVEVLDVALVRPDDRCAGFLRCARVEIHQCATRQGVTGRLEDPVQGVVVLEAHGREGTRGHRVRDGRGPVGTSGDKAVGLARSPVPDGQRVPLCQKRFGERLSHGTEADDGNVGAELVS
jgi:hypothetical protein